MDPIQVGDILDGKYEIEGTLGEGAMGVVFSARHTALNKRVAVKTLRPEIARDQALVGRFEQEARAASAIGHPNIIEVFDLGSAPNGVRYMVMEHLAGESLAESIVRTPVQPLDRVVFIALQILSALTAAHKRGIVHRDLKPENVFVVRMDDRPDIVKLLDFGISKVLAEIADPRIAGGDSSARQTKLGTVLGTPLYMSPEQARGVIDIDHRTDLWAVGVCLYEMLTGSAPFDGENYNQIMGAILQGQFRPPRQLNPDIPEAIERVILKGLAQQREDRYQSATEMRAALEAATRGLAPAASPALSAPPAVAAATALLATPTSPTASAPSASSSQQLQSGLSAASAGAGGSDDMMMSALDKIASGEVNMAFASDSAPPQSTAPAAAPVLTPAPSAAPARSATPSMKAPSKPAAAPVGDQFAPPDSDDEVMDLALNVAEPATRAKPSLATDAPVADFRSTSSRAESSTPRRTGARTVTTSSGGSFGKIIVWLAALVIVGAGGLATYRYITLGYILSAPSVPTTEVSLSLSPSSGELIVDGLAYPSRTLALVPGKPRTLRAMATGRVQYQVVLSYEASAEGGDSPQALAIQLTHRIPSWTRDVMPAQDDQKGPASAAGFGAHDPAVHKLDRFRQCLAPLGLELRERQRAYLATTRGKAKHIKKNNVPKVAPLPVDLLSTCRSATEAAATDQPRFPELDNAMLAVMPAVTELDQTLKDVGVYYREEKYRNDRLRWGRKQHSVLIKGMSAALVALEGAGQGVADRRAYWQTVELAEIESSEGQNAHWRMRRLAYAAQAWIGAVTRKLPSSERKARAKALVETFDASNAWAAANSDAMKEIDGAGIFLTSLAKLAELAKAPGKGKGKKRENHEAEVETLLGLFNLSVDRFNEMVL